MLEQHDGEQWKVVLGSPYRTSLWQVGDARSQNEQYKKYTYTGKAVLSTRKRSLYNYHSGLNFD